LLVSWINCEGKKKFANFLLIKLFIIVYCVKQKRRSARNTKRKKYHDEVDLNLSEEDADVDADIAAVAAASTGGAVLKPVQYISVVGAWCLFVVYLNSLQDLIER